MIPALLGGVNSMGGATGSRACSRGAGGGLPGAIHASYASPMMLASLCQTCSHAREVTSGRGSVFLLCRRSQSDPAYPRYPHQPVVRCAGYAAER